MVKKNIARKVAKIFSKKRESPEEKVRNAVTQWRKACPWAAVK